VDGDGGIFGAGVDGAFEKQFCRCGHIQVMRTDDSELWARAQGGETKAFGELYERHADSIQSFCLWRTADPEVAEDATAIVFLEAWRKRERLSLSTDSAAPLLLGIATNVMRHQWRSARRHRDALARLGPAIPGNGLEEDAIGRIEAVRRVQAAGAGIRALPRREREVLALIAWGELTYEETAAALGVPVGTVCSRPAHARKRLDGSADGIGDLASEEGSG
jgi:RNA polymerase sigma-70 factor (ECF subfamily)